jgi:arsenate reductase
VVQAMAEVGIDLTGRTTRHLTEHTVAASDIVVTTSGAMPALPEQRHEDWPVDDVAGQDLDVRVIRADVRARVERLAAHLMSPAEPVGDGS